MVLHICVLHTVLHVRTTSVLRTLVLLACAHTCSHMLVCCAHLHVRVMFACSHTCSHNECAAHTHSAHVLVCCAHKLVRTTCAQCSRSCVCCAHTWCAQCACCARTYVRTFMCAAHTWFAHVRVLRTLACACVMFHLFCFLCSQSAAHFECAAHIARTMFCELRSQAHNVCVTRMCCAHAHTHCACSCVLRTHVVTCMFTCASRMCLCFAQVLVLRTSSCSQAHTRAHTSATHLLCCRCVLRVHTPLVLRTSVVCCALRAQGYSLVLRTSVLHTHMVLLTSVLRTLVLRTMFLCCMFTH